MNYILPIILNILLCSPNGMDQQTTGATVKPFMIKRSVYMLRSKSLAFIRKFTENRHVNWLVQRQKHH